MVDRSEMSGDFNPQQVNTDNDTAVNMRANRSLVKVGLTLAEIIAFGAAACGPAATPPNPESTSSKPGATLIVDNPPQNPLDVGAVKTPETAPSPVAAARAEVKIQPIETTAMSSGPAINPPEYYPGGGEVTGLAENSEEKRVKVAFPVFKQSLIDSGALKVGEPYYFSGTDDLAANKAYIDSMIAYLNNHPELEARLVQDGGQVLAFIQEKMPDGSYAVKFAFKQNGALAYAEPNLFDVDTVEGNVPVPKGFSPEFRYNPADKHWYLFAVNEDTGKANSWFKTDGATRDNLASQWQDLESPQLKAAYAEFDKFHFDYKSPGNEITFQQTGNTVVGVDKSGMTVYEQVEGQVGSFDLHYVVSHLNPDDMARDFKNKPEGYGKHTSYLGIFRDLYVKHRAEINALFPRKKGEQTGGTPLLLHEFEDKKGGWAWGFVVRLMERPYNEQAESHDLLYETASGELVDLPIIGINALRVMSFWQ